MQSRNELIQLVQQQGSDTCGIACVAMAARRSFEDIQDTIVGALVDNPIEHSYNYHDPLLLDKLLVLNKILPVHCHYGIALESAEYIAVVPSLNITGGYHTIVISAYVTQGSGVVVLDPNSGVPGTKVYTDNSSMTFYDLVRCVDASDLSTQRTI